MIIENSILRGYKQLENVTVSKRMKAYFIDLAFAIIVAMLLALLISVVLYLISKIIHNELYDLIVDIGYEVCLILAILLYPIFKDIIFTDGSIGYKIMKIKVLDQKTNLPPIKKKLILKGLFFYVHVIDFIFSAIRLDRLSLSDIITDTRVVYKSDYDTEKEFSGDKIN